MNFTQPSEMKICYRVMAPFSGYTKPRLDRFKFDRGAVLDWEPQAIVAGMASVRWHDRRFFVLEAELHQSCERITN